VPYCDSHPSELNWWILGIRISDRSLSLSLHFEDRLPLALVAVKRCNPGDHDVVIENDLSNVTDLQSGRRGLLPPLRSIDPHRKEFLGHLFARVARVLFDAVPERSPKVSVFRVYLRACL